MIDMDYKYSFLAGTLLSFLCSCSSESFPDDFMQNLDVSGTSSSLHCVIPRNIRSRAADFDLPLWGINDSWNGSSFVHDKQLMIQYAVYDNAGNVFEHYTWEDFKSSGDAVYKHLVSGNSFDLKIELPERSSVYKIFLWVQKYDPANSFYTLDYNNKSIGYADNGSLSAQNMSENADAFYSYSDIYVGSNSLTLKRPFLQINILTPEVFDEKNQADWGDGIGCDLGFINTDYSTDFRRIPNKWFFDSDRFEWATIINDDMPNRSFNAGNKITGTIDGRKMAYAGCFYIFAPKTKGYWKDGDSTGFGVNSLSLFVSNSNQPHSSSLSLLIDLPMNMFHAYVGQNERYIIYPEDSGGLLWKKWKFRIIVEPDFSQGGYY